MTLTSGDDPSRSVSHDGYEAIESTRVYDGRIVGVRRDKVRMPTGAVATREVVETTDAAAIVATDRLGCVCLIRQYRHPQAGFIWELPAGRLDRPGESALEAAKRELREEVGLASDSWTPLTTYVSSAGFATERIHLFLAEDVVPAEPDPAFQRRHEEQGIQIEMRSLEQVLAEIRVGELTDAKAIIGLLLASQRLRC